MADERIAPTWAQHPLPRRGRPSAMPADHPLGRAAGHVHPEGRPALAAGCTAVLKPAEPTPLSSLAFAELFAKLGLGSSRSSPVATQQAVTIPLLSEPPTQQVVLPGSTGVGRLLLEKSGRRVLRTSMELGGNAPFLVFDDADLDVAVREGDDRQDAPGRTVLRRRQPVPRTGRHRRGLRCRGRREDGRHPYRSPRP